MGLMGKILLGAGIFASGFGTCYMYCVDRDYKVVQQQGEMYVMDRETGRMAEVDDDFEKREEETDKDCARYKDIIDRIESAYNALMK